MFVKVKNKPRNIKILKSDSPSQNVLYSGDRETQGKVSKMVEDFRKAQP